MKIFVVLGLIAYAMSMPSGEEGEGFEGDIILTPDQIAAVVEQDSKKNGNSFAAIRTNHWKTSDGKAQVIKYYIESSLTSESQAMKAIEDAVAEYHKHTCIRFQRVYSTPSERYISFFKDGGCYSYVGKTRSTGRQPISLGYGCWYKGTAMHEMGHALGFFHEQSRPDRDNFVEIVTENIREANLHNFNKYKIDRINSMDSPYDILSLMHYGKGYFAKSRGLVTIRTKDPADQDKIGQRNGFSEEDIVQLNKMYNCGNTPTSAPRTTTSAPGGCVDKRDESTCIYWKNHEEDYCNTHSYVKENCQKTCGLCGGVTTTRAPRTTTTKAPTTSAPSGCVDKRDESTCRSWKASTRDYCNTNSYVKENCQRTCGLCGGVTTTRTPSGSCVDKRTDDRCESWKIICDSNSYVQEQCRKTCKLC